MDERVQAALAAGLPAARGEIEAAEGETGADPHGAPQPGLLDGDLVGVAVEGEQGERQEADEQQGERDPQGEIR